MGAEPDLQRESSLDESVRIDDAYDDDVESQYASVSKTIAASAHYTSVRQLFTSPADYDPSQETHYVLVVHGTFDAPPAKGAPPPWYFLDTESAGNFCHVIAKDLQPTPLGFDAVWRTLPDSREAMRLRENVPYPFHWSGQNTHDSRVAAGKALAQLINAIGKADPSARVHIVAHSHGGNVALKAVSKYLSMLRRESGRSYNDQITAAFWEAHAEGYRAIREHQEVQLPAVWMLLFAPFLVVKRPWRGEEALGAFPYAYFKSLDSLLRLPKARQAKYLRKKWAGGASTNCVGRMVFLGTPFYTKHWDKQAALTMAGSIVGLSVLVFVVIVGAVVTVKYAIFREINTADLTGRELTFWVTVAVVSVAMVVYNTLSSKRYSDGNVYFTEKKAWSPAMRALVLNAGKLDEAALALSTEPLVRAYMMPQVKAMLTPDPWRMLRPFPAKTWPVTLANLYNNCWVVLWAVVLAVPYALLWLLNFLLVPYFSNQLLRLFITLGFGLQKNELDCAQVYVEEWLRLPPATHSITHWNVQKILTAATLDQLKDLRKRSIIPGEAAATEEALMEAQSQVVDPHAIAMRWRFLWDDEELEKKAAESTTLALLKSEVAKMAHNPRISRVAFERELALVCVTLEERYKDMTGNVELSHGSYFRNHVVIAVIAHFLAHGDVPSWAPSLGEMTPPDLDKPKDAWKGPLSRLFSRRITPTTSEMNEQ
ncbi:hypothetical protein CLOM_g20146 [Closterium sp. NIES-68]|nr:hypothetical protein CLOM_g20146 [Closterium sp. NIES-68]GJP68123.1 hypothetical protein CLOP_g24866 [Closterium sp. NIES-67]